MSKKIWYSTEGIIVELSQAEVLWNQGKTIRDANRSLGITEQLYGRRKIQP